jgi:hypothetical protein
MSHSDSLDEVLVAARELVELDGSRCPGLRAVAQFDERDHTSWLAIGGRLVPLITQASDPPARLVQEDLAAGQGSGEGVERWRDGHDAPTIGWYPALILQAGAAYQRHDRLAGRGQALTVGDHPGQRSGPGWLGQDAGRAGQPRNGWAQVVVGDREPGAAMPSANVLVPLGSQTSRPASTARTSGEAPVAWTPTMRGNRSATPHWTSSWQPCTNAASVTPSPTGR